MLLLLLASTAVLAFCCDVMRLMPRQTHGGTDAIETISTIMTCATQQYHSPTANVAAVVELVRVLPLSRTAPQLSEALFVGATAGQPMSWRTKLACLFLARFNGSASRLHLAGRMCNFR